VPFLVKDLDDYAGLPTRHGSRVHAGAGPAADQTPLMDAYDAAGLVVIGKSASPENGYLPTTEPVGQPPTRNPWDLSRSSGGSSGGAAAAVAAGVVPVAHATDGGGSIRIPASCCGLFGLKPSNRRMRSALRGRRAAAPITIAHQHVVSRSVRDSAALFAATEAPDAPFPVVGAVTGPGSRRLRIGLARASMIGTEPHPEVGAAVDAAAALLTELGHVVEPTAWPVDGVQFGRDFGAYWASGAAADHAAAAALLGREPTDADLEPFSLIMATRTAALPPTALAEVVERLRGVAARYDAWFERQDVVLSPVLGLPPVPLGYVSGDVPIETLGERLATYVGYTSLHNVAGAPAMSVPLHWTADGLPVGVQFAARAGDERTLFELAFELEQARPWAHRRPPVHA
jgi:amidase